MEKLHSIECGKGPQRVANYQRETGPALLNERTKMRRLVGEAAQLVVGAAVILPRWFYCSELKGRPLHRKSTRPTVSGT